MLKPKNLIIILIILSLIIIATNCSIKGLSLHETQNLEGFVSKELIADISEKNIFLYGIRNTNTETFNKITVKVGSKEKTFNWVSTWNLIGYPPKLTLTDLDNDGKQELAIILTESFGSDTHLASIHILDINTLEEIPMDNSMEILKKIVKRKIEGDYLNLNIQNETYKVRLFDFTDNLTGLWYDVPLGNQVSYSVEGNNIVARLSVHIKPSVSVGNIKLIYQYKDHRFQIVNITFEPNILKFLIGQIPSIRDKFFKVRQNFIKV